MSLMLDNFMYIGETPWHGLGTTFEQQPSSVSEIIEAGKFGWNTSAIKMKTDLHDSVLNYHAIYREDNNSVLGVVNNVNPKIAQNADMFNALDPLLQNGDIQIETAASLDGGKKVFGCFKISDTYQVMDDEIDHYLVVMNDHLKPDGKITIMNTPVRVVCQNTLSAALDTNLMKYRIVCTKDTGLNTALSGKLLEAAKVAQENLVDKASKFYNNKVSRSDMDKLLDELFPLLKVSDSSSHQKANEHMEIARQTFIECLSKPDLYDYRGTQYQVFNALLDFTQHYTKNAEFGVDLEKRMALLPGSGVDSPSSMVTKYLKLVA